METLTCNVLSSAGNTMPVMIAENGNSGAGGNTLISNCCSLLMYTVLELIVMISSDDNVLRTTV